MKFFFLLVYRMTVSPLLIFALPLLSLSGGKIQRGLQLRRRPYIPLPEGPRPVWIHAASGEFEYAKSVIREIKDRNPRQPVVVTYFSPTYAGNVEAFPGVDISRALPLDLPGPCLTFLKKYNPRLLLIARTDLWPEMLEQCRRRKIPVRLFSYTQRPRLSALKRWATRLRLAWVDEIDCVSEADRTAVQSISPKSRVQTLGDTRYDQVKFRLDHPKPLPDALKPAGDMPCLVAGSTWPEDEDVLLSGLGEALKSRRLKLILVPHEPTQEHLASLSLKLKSLDLNHSLFSAGRDWSEKEVLLVDQVGVLAELYLWADLAFVGGSFRKSVHSVMEALGAGCFTLVGPRHLNNREALEFKELSLGGEPALSVVNSAQDLRRKVDEVLARPGYLAAFSAKLKAEFQTRLGASRRLVEKLGIYSG